MWAYYICLKYGAHVCLAVCLIVFVTFHFIRFVLYFIFTFMATEPCCSFVVCFLNEKTSEKWYSARKHTCVICSVCVYPSFSLCKYRYLFSLVVSDLFVFSSFLSCSVIFLCMNVPDVCNIIQCTIDIYVSYVNTCIIVRIITAIIWGFDQHTWY